MAFRGRNATYYYDILSLSFTQISIHSLHKLTHTYAFARLAPCARDRPRPPPHTRCSRTTSTAQMSGQAQPEAFWCEKKNPPPKPSKPLQPPLNATHSIFWDIHKFSQSLSGTDLPDPEVYRSPAPFVLLLRPYCTPATVTVTIMHAACHATWLWALLQSNPDSARSHSSGSLVNFLRFTPNAWTSFVLG